MTIVQEKRWHIVERGKGDLSLEIHEGLGEPSGPIIIYDCRQHALLLRSPEYWVICDYIHPLARLALFVSERVTVIERAMDRTVVRAYAATMNRAEVLPLRESLIQVLPSSLGDIEYPDPSGLGWSLWDEVDD